MPRKPIKRPRKGHDPVPGTKTVGRTRDGTKIISFTTNKQGKQIMTGFRVIPKPKD